MHRSVVADCAVVITTVSPATDCPAAYFAGVIAAEGSFTRVKAGTRGHKERFALQVSLGATDQVTCEALHDFFGVGSVIFVARRKQHYDDEVTFRVSSIGDLIEVVMPFMDQHLPISYKRRQYMEWRGALLEYSERTARQPRVFGY